MVSDSITNASANSAPNAKDFAKKKRANRSAKLKQCKLDARREQWLSQVKNKGGREDLKGENRQQSGSGQSLENLETRRQRDDENGSVHQDSDSESPSNSPIGLTSVLSGNHSSGNCSGSSSSCSSGSSTGCFSGSTTEEEEGGDDGCLDDWEAVADALAADEKPQNPPFDPPPEGETVGGLQSRGEHEKESVLPDNSRPECVKRPPRTASGNNQAWRPDDAFRPQSLPNLSKQYSFPNTKRHYGSGAIPWGCSKAMSVPSSCPICFEDLDKTDSSFLPCLCGFRLCLFCHKRILEEDGRCPGCRKPYEHECSKAEPCLLEGSLTFRLTRSHSMITRT
ncbi:hypothetical protein BT93_K0323 [Corymbia citriodora subsp. variegata]|nr:hypothetical protein BT93_K0323 [Corymbia citriodora subsp. variegata]